MPDCPYCNLKIFVSKGGRHHSNRYHVVQDYYCRKCHKFFADPKRFDRVTPTPPCPECGSTSGVSRGGWYRPARGEPYRRWRCECGRSFQFPPKKDREKKA